MLYYINKPTSNIKWLSKTSESLAQELKEEQEYKEELANKKEEVNSLEFIEQTARERLDMYLPNERVYVDAGM